MYCIYSLNTFTFFPSSTKKGVQSYIVNIANIKMCNALNFVLRYTTIYIAYNRLRVRYGLELLFKFVKLELDKL